MSKDLKKLQKEFIANSVKQNPKMTAAQAGKIWNNAGNVIVLSYGKITAGNVIILDSNGDIIKGA